MSIAVSFHRVAPERTEWANFQQLTKLHSFQLIFSHRRNNCWCIGFPHHTIVLFYWNNYRQKGFCFVHACKRSSEFCTRAFFLSYSPFIFLIAIVCPILKRCQMQREIQLTAGWLAAWKPCVFVCSGRFFFPSPSEARSCGPWNERLLRRKRTALSAARHILTPRRLSTDTPESCICN